MGRKLFEAMLMKIVYIDLRGNEGELFWVRERVYAQVKECTKNSELIPEIVHRMFFHMYITQMYASERFGEQIEREFGDIAKNII